MNPTFLASFALCTALAHPAAWSQSALPNAKARAGKSNAQQQQTEAEADVRELAYGRDPLQKLDYWRPAEAGAPLIVFIHGGGWKRGDKRNSTGQKAAHLVSRGYAFASLNYRLVPAATVEEQAKDIATALAILEKQSAELGFNKDRVILMGHSAGAHLAALVGTYPDYLKDAGLGDNALRGVVLLDGACYDVPSQIAQGGRLMHDTYIEAFGSDPKRQLALSPTHHASAPNAPAFLILHVQRLDAAHQSSALGKALTQAGTRVDVHPVDGIGMQGHMEINRRLGDPDYPATPVVDDWLKRTLGR